MFPLHMLGPCGTWKKYIVYASIFLYGAVYLFMTLFKGYLLNASFGQCTTGFISCQMDDADESAEHGTYLFYQKR